jgi:TPR repeat protein
MNTKHFTFALLLLANIVCFRGNAQLTNIFLTPPEDHARYVATLLNEKDRKQFEQILAKAETGDANSQCSIGEFYANGMLGVTQDIAEAVKWYRKSAEKNFAEAQFNLGWCFANAQGVTRDQTEALSWWRKAAEQNYPDAQFNLGWCYSHGQGGIPKRPIKIASKLNTILVLTISMAMEL